jgi:hypothetical protein
MGTSIGPRPRPPVHVAIRTLGHPYALEPALVAWFTQEARAAAGLSHPNIVAVFDSGSEAGMHDLVRSRGSTIRSGRTNIEVSLEYNPPGDKAGELVAELAKDPDQQVQRGRRFPQGGERGGLVVG